MLPSIGPSLTIFKPGDIFSKIFEFCDFFTKLFRFLSNGNNRITPFVRMISANSWSF